jgi:hypothetical protein
VAECKEQWEEHGSWSEEGTGVRAGLGQPL